MKIPIWYWCWVLFAGFTLGSLATWQAIDKPENLCRNLERIHEDF
jgi:hypothetical protein